jgi:general secretion pathway protein A
MTGSFSSFFELRDNPFRANPDPRYLFLTQQTKQTLDQIIEGIRGRKGLLLLTGEVGTGKTVLLNRLMEWLEQERIPKAFIFNSHVKASELLDLILADFAVPFNAQRGTPLAHLQGWLQDRHCAGQTPVLFVDEAQGLGLRTLEELRMLLNLQDAQGSLLQIVLCGQPEFEETLKRPELRQLRQRIALRCRTAPLTLEETQGYIDARLHLAGASSAAVFHPEAIQALSHYSRGLPRVLNALCEESLTRAAREKIRPVPGRMVGEAAHELQYDEIRPFVPISASNDDGVFSGLFGHSAGFAGIPDIFAAATPLVQDAPLDAKAPGIPSREPKPLAAAAAAGEATHAPLAHLAARPSAPEPGPAGPRVLRAPIAFPSPSDHQRSSSPVSNEFVARVASASKATAPSESRIVERTAAPAVTASRPAVPKEVPKDVLKEIAKQAAKKENDFSRRWRRHHVSLMNNVKSTLSAIALGSRVRLAQLQTRSRSSFNHLSEQWLIWRTKQSTFIKTNFKWNDLALSCLRWLRAPSNTTQRRHALPTPQVRAPLTESSARILAAHARRTRSSRRAGGSKVIGSLKKTPRFSTAILHWLQEPSHSVRERKPPRSSNTHLA